MINRGFWTNGEIAMMIWLGIMIVAELLVIYSLFTGEL